MNLSPDPYPSSFKARNQWVISRRGKRNLVDQRVPYAFLKERELASDGQLTEVVTIFLTNRECPWKCFMCDLWQNTLEDPVASGTIPAQITFALNKLEIPLSGPERAAFQIKLYNSGSFFDPKAIPVQDYSAISDTVNGFGNLIVESHPRLIGDRCLQWKHSVSSPLEVAMGLETANSDALGRLNKGFQLGDFQRACETLQSAGIAIRVFLLVNGPFIKPQEQREWVRRSVEFAKTAGASVICLIPTRHDSGAIRELCLSGQFVPTVLSQLEIAFDDALLAGGVRLFADLWDLRSFSQCDQCFNQRLARLEKMNEKQILIDRVDCSHCDGN